ncbi:hypothetical protein [Colwellia sp. Bg11-28]|uniref:hypothetical protein n=1 Tax=Colwellia sp. Bg11-28 TaxID=2058305 RepID=UPI000C3391F3|nr:hypothetical protein [Colwellia sp. Bg11-28]PKH85430.1 hypothetical protein CXF79_19395 [Colwellia sp. Bg11-28]
MDIKAKLETVNELLSQDPYQINLLYIKVLLNLTLGNKGEVTQLLKILGRIPGINEQISPLILLAEETKILVSSGEFWFIFPLESDDESQKFIIDFSLEHYDRLLTITGRIPQGTIIFEMTPYPISFLDYSIEGLNIIELSGLMDDSDRYSSTIAHELSHVFWPCKNRVISEGIALVYENKLATAGAFIPSVTKAIEYVKRYTGTFPSLTTLLTNSFKDDVFFERRTSSTDEQILIYNLAFLLIKFFSESASNSSIDVLIAAINKSEDKSADTIFLSLCGKSSDELEAFLNYPKVEDTSAIDLQEVEDNILEDRLLNKDVSYEKFYQKLHLLSVNSEIEILKARVILMRLYAQINQGLNIDLVILCEAEQLADSLSDKGLVTESSYIKARISLIKLVKTNDFIEKSQLISKVHGHFQSSFGDNRLKSEAYIDYAKFEFATPEAFGRDIGKVKELLKLAEGDMRYRQEIDSIKADIELEIKGRL